MSKNTEVVVVHPTPQADCPKSPLIILPHGGPHSSFNTCFSTNIAGFVNLGFTCVLVNYTGSTGFGNDSILSLVGKIGQLEVNETFKATQWALDLPNIDKENVFIFGGSHGGFITAHLIAQYPNLYTAGCLRNPVTNVGEMVSNSDIPDWCFSEAGIAFDSQKPKVSSIEGLYF